MTGATCFSGICAPEASAPGVDWRWMAEIEPFPARVAAARHPVIPNLGDVTAADFIQRAQGHGCLDLLVAGSPCQAFSVAGSRQSLDDARGNLTLRLVEIVDAVNPGILLWENVPGVLSTADNAFGCFLGALAGCDTAIEPVPLDRRSEWWRYDGNAKQWVCRWPDAGMVVGPTRRLAWRVLDAQHFRLAQRRRRVFVVASACEWADPVQILLIEKSLSRYHPPSKKARKDIASGAASGAGNRGFWRALAAAFTDGAVSGESGSAPAIAGTLGRGSSERGWCNDLDRTTFIPAVAYGGNNTGGEIDVATACNAEGGAGRMDFETETLVTHSLRADGFDASEDGTGRGTPIIAFNLRGRDGGSQAEPADQASLRSASGGSSRSYVAPGVGVRRLMPVECERLQGFPDGYTAIDGAADGPRYKALGNSMARPVIGWIINRIITEHRRIYPGARR